MTDSDTRLSAATEHALLPCPLCNKGVMFRKALWPSDGNVDAIIHAEPTTCGMVEFSDGTIDESILAKWNERPSGAAQAVSKPDLSSTTISYSYRTVTIECGSLEHRDDIYDWLMEHAAQPPAGPVEKPGSFRPCDGCDGHECDNECKYPGVVSPSSAATSDALTDSCRAHVAETALREIRRYCETMDASRSETLIAQVKRTVDAALALSSDLPQSSWQPIETRPDSRYENVTYLIANDKGQVAPFINGIIHNNVGTPWDWNYGESVAAWMPLPAYSVTRPHFGGGQ